MKSSTIVKPELYARLYLREETSDGRLEVFLDRLLMRFYDNPSLIVYLKSAQVKSGKIELVFSQLPDEVIPQIVSATGVDAYDVYKFRETKTIDGRSAGSGYPYIGYVFTPNEDDLSNLST